jgi:DNA-binding MarR family transcriptional regulator
MPQTAPTTRLDPLTAAEEAFIRSFTAAAVAMPRAFDADLEREQRMSRNEYLVLVHLSEAPDRKLRMSDLADRAALSLSGMTRIVQRLEALSLVERQRCPEDGRGWNAALTTAGLERLREAWPTHLASARQRVFTPLGEVDLTALAAALQRVAEACEAGTTPS